MAEEWKPRSGWDVWKDGLLTDLKNTKDIAVAAHKGAGFLSPANFVPFADPALRTLGGEDVEPWEWGLDALGSVGDGIKYLGAMTPIVATWGKGVKQGERIGKNARNLAKATMPEEEKEKIFYHLTKRENAEPIMKEGLKAKSSNYGQNTGDADEWAEEGLNWLSLRPDRIPVLRRYSDDDNATSLLQINMPNSFYWSKPRYKFDKGRRSEPVRIEAGDRTSSVGREADYVIDTFQGDIPPSMITDVSNERNSLKHNTPLSDEANQRWWLLASQIDRSRLPKEYRNKLGIVDYDFNLKLNENEAEELLDYLPNGEKRPKRVLKEDGTQGYLIPTARDPFGILAKQNIGHIEAGYHNLDDLISNKRRDYYINKTVDDMLENANEDEFAEILKYTAKSKSPQELHSSIENAVTNAKVNGYESDAERRMIDSYFKHRKKYPIF